jgi:hypothetical protein
MQAAAKLLLLAPLAALAAGCWNDDDDDDDDPAPGAEPSYSVTVTGADVVNKDSGEEVAVGGLPLEGGVLTVE